jgi:hypothetical protein
MELTSAVVIGLLNQSSMARSALDCAILNIDKRDGAFIITDEQGLPGQEGVPQGYLYEGRIEPEYIPPQEEEPQQEEPQQYEPKQSDGECCCCVM